MIPLFICSVISLSIIIDKIILFFNIHNNRKKNELNEILLLIKEKKIKQAKKKMSKSKDYLIKIAYTTLSVIQTNREKKAINESLKYSEKMNRFLSILDTITTIAPLIGILGTVVGIIYSFQIMSESAKPDPTLITKGIGYALTTTFSGLLISIISLIGLNYFSAKINKEILIIEKFMTKIELYLNKK